LTHAFSERWVDRHENCYWLDALDSIKKEENETMKEFNKRFNDLIHDLPDDIRPPNDAILIYYMGAFSGETYYQLRDKKPSSLRRLKPKPIKLSQTCKLHEDLIYSTLPWAILQG
jgi:hypothetical protein